MKISQRRKLRAAVTSTAIPRRKLGSAAAARAKILPVSAPFIQRCTCSHGKSMHYTTRVDNQLHHPCNFLNCTCKDFTPAKQSTRTRVTKSQSAKPSADQA
jgi:hypothetical protein